ncbi:hypothetical protein QTJ16_002840 [Diplocarpon rosae]|uniref:Uncharacterized protein n=1 Tax=Diplocarpon rosae TaxID=946125 RepID=A0AAD9T422_9HELO|nr:hypothetical protein QTJ16_002840 [Diplocarpon rosae]PBP26396.1 hypothetical protein BUE80_DR002764 [Diplocarpon rosae]
MSDPQHTNEAKGDTTTLGGLLSGAFKTPGVKNIEAAYTRAGASSNHTPGAASRLGSQDQVGASEHAGRGSTKASEGTSDPRQEPSFIGKAFNNMLNGTGNTK